MKRITTIATGLPPVPVGKAWEEVSASFDRFCLATGIETLGMMMESDAEAACGPRHARGPGRRGHRWGHTTGKIGFHGGKMAIDRPRVRGRDVAAMARSYRWRAGIRRWLRTGLASGR